MEYNGIHPIHPQILHKSTKKRQISQTSVPPALALAAFASSQKHDFSMIQAGQIDSLPAPSLTIAWPGTGTRFLQISSLGTECRQPLYVNYIQLPWLLKSTQFVPYAYNTHRYILYTVCNIYIYNYIYNYIYIYMVYIYMVYVIYIYTRYIKTIKYMVYVHAMILRRHMRKTPKKRRDHLGITGNHLANPCHI